jgi:hypothetical protein
VRKYTERHPLTTGLITGVRQTSTMVSTQMFMLSHTLMHTHTHTRTHTDTHTHAHTHTHTHTGKHISADRKSDNLNVGSFEPGSQVVEEVTSPHLHMIKTCFYETLLALYRIRK